MRRVDLLRVVVLLILGSLIFAGCGGAIESPPVEKNGVGEPKIGAHQKLLTASQEFTEGGGLKLLGADELFQLVIMDLNPQYYLVDIRQRDDFLDASIEGSINIPFDITFRKEVLARLPSDKTIVIIDYDGGLACQTAVFWGMLGFDTQVLARGMESWVASPPKEVDRDCYPVTQEVIAWDKTFDLPSLPVDEELELKELLPVLNEKLLKEERSWQIPVEEVKTKIDKGKKLNLLDIREKEHFLTGHIEGSINIPFDKLADLGNLQKLPFDEEIIIIDYYGHFSHGAVRLLSQLGYKAVAMDRGISNWIGDLEVIGRNPLVCGWLECCGVAEDAQEGDTALTQCNCDWETYPTVETEMAAAVSSGC